jgi:phosphodiesterase/alkaline phosphatase D-like protein
MWSRREVLSAGAAAAIAPATLAGCGAEGDDVEAPPDTGPRDTASDTPVDTEPSDTPIEPDTDAPADTGDGPQGVAFDADAIPADPAFDEAVRAGAMTTSSAVAITRARGQASVRVRVWEPTATPGLVSIAFEADLAPNDGGYARADIQGLQAGRSYRYGFFVLDATGAFAGRSDLGAFKTAPALGELPTLTLALLSCNGGATGRRDAIGRVADHPEIDLLVHVGDMVYNDGAVTRADYRASWASWMESVGYRAGLAAAGMYATWDDHEVDNDWDPETIPVGQLVNAVSSWVENVPMAPGPQGTLWSAWRWGDTAEVFVLDCRTERLPSSRATVGQYLSRAQMDWLKDGLRASTARFKIVANSVPITNMPGLWDFGAGDRWEGYEAQRDEILNFIAENDIRNVWFLAGDFHVCFVGKVQPGGAGVLNDTWEIAITSGNVNPLGANLNPPQYRFGTAQPNLGVIAFDPVADTVTARFYDPGTNRLVEELVLTQA